MKIGTPLTLAMLAFAGVLFAAPAHAQSTAHHDHAAHAAPAKPATAKPAAAKSATAKPATAKPATAKPAAAPTQRWATDAPLRAGMRNLREATETLNHYQMGHLDDVQRDNAVEKIDAAIKDMIANCKLKPEADAALHGLLAKFIAGANAARAGKFGKAELAPMQDALAQYPQLFDDRDWGKPAH